MVDVGGHTRDVMLNQSDMLANDPDYKQLATFPGTIMLKGTTKNGKGKKR
jgi:hypothetical protein